MLCFSSFRIQIRAVVETWRGKAAQPRAALLALPPLPAAAASPLTARVVVGSVVPR